MRQRRASAIQSRSKMGLTHTKYEKRFAAMAKKVCTLGALDKDLAELFGVHRDTIYYWREKHPEFAAACEEGKPEADAKVLRAFFLRATGYSHPDIDIRVIENQIVKTEITKHYPPDTTAGIFWLKNRMGWRDKVEVGATDNEGNDVQSDWFDVARRMVFILEQGSKHGQTEH